MNDKQQLSAIGEHMREMEGCKQKKHSYAQVMAWAGDYEKIGGHGLIVEMLKSYAGMLGSSKRKPEFKVPDGWRLVPAKMTDAMENAIYKELTLVACTDSKVPTRQCSTQRQSTSHETITG